MYKKIVTLIAALAALPSFARQVERGRGLSYDEAVVMLLEYNNQVRADRYNEEAR